MRSECSFINLDIGLILSIQIAAKNLEGEKDDY